MKGLDGPKAIRPAGIGVRLNLTKEETQTNLNLLYELKSELVGKQWYQRRRQADLLVAKVAPGGE